MGLFLILSINMTRKEIGQKARQYLQDAQILINGKRYEGAVYLLGYVLELSLKRAICKCLDWQEYPPEGKWDNYRTFKSHNLVVLLSLSRKEKMVRKTLFTEWSNVSQWDPGTLRYRSKKFPKNDTIILYRSVLNILKAL